MIVVFGSSHLSFSLSPHFCPLPLPQVEPFGGWIRRERPLRNRPPQPTFTGLFGCSFDDDVSNVLRHVRSICIRASG